ncbi:VOC family protein [Geothermobacter hydrogeniphilus]|uniref:VOC domain-containing protein n=1 Tax=Geothermobacter hydrogeniphilus TaxID=1969733 RepID=A0A1X0YA72_9BACT|nr:VOC family protein [Geothermobacter hydrogeniphilus]ORJ62101.1 hypothetical protein B5V00_04945 [Geothermobacter hydrogeniphilus]
MSLTLTLAVADLDRTEFFYRDILGLQLETFEPAPEFPRVLLLLCGDTAILFRRQQALEASHPALFEHLDRHPKGVGMTLELELPDLEAARRAIDRQQLHLLYELDDDEFKRREIWLHDPDGYLLILT